MRTLLLATLLTACAADAGYVSQPPSGQQKLDALLADPHPDDPAWVAEVEATAGQKHAQYSGLYWFQDLDEALDTAAETDRPVLSLRMLGELTDTYSCANSRFFRTVLYANPEVSAYLKENFVLHWSSERPVPKITIDMGDGRQLVSTVTGNSAHYVLDTEGRPVDVLPGLYAPEHFVEELELASELVDRLDGVEGDAWSVAMMDWHRDRIDASLERLKLSGRLQVRPEGVDFPGVPTLRQLVMSRSFQPTLHTAQQSRPLHLVPAQRALPMAVGKAAVEVPIVDSFLVHKPWGPTLHPDDILPASIDPLHPTTLALMDADQPEFPDALHQRFQDTLARDSTWNRDVLHTLIRQRLLQQPSNSFETLNRYVYTFVFGTPAGDPWLGMYDPTVYTGLPNAGIR